MEKDWAEGWKNIRIKDIGDVVTGVLLQKKDQKIIVEFYLDKTS